MYSLDDFVNDFVECSDITKQEARKYTKLYIKLFPNLWDGDTLDRDKIYQLIMMGRGDAIAREHKSTTDEE